MGAQGKITAVCRSERKGTRKSQVPEGELRVDHGLLGDAHAGSARQVSLLAAESIARMRGGGLEVGPGDFAENLTTSGLVIHTLPVGARLKVGEAALLEITQIGKECHSACEIRRLTGECVMPTEGVFARVLVAGKVRPGDSIEVVEGG